MESFSYHYLATCRPEPKAGEGDIKPSMERLKKQIYDCGEIEIDQAFIRKQR